jgi:hypothetical protein
LVGNDGFSSGGVVDFRLGTINLAQLGGELLLAVSQQRFDGPIFNRLEGADFVLAFNNEPERNRLYSARAQSLLHGFPEHRACLVPHKAIEHTSGLLRVNLARVYC